MINWNEILKVIKSLAWKWNKSRLSLHILKIGHREFMEQLNRGQLVPVNNEIDKGTRGREWNGNQFVRLFW